MLMLRRGIQPDYRLCDMTVTVYHREGLTRQVFTKAFYEFTRRLTTAAGVDSGENDFLLVIPCKEPVVFPGDKVVLGEGPEGVSWGALNPANYPSLSVVREVRHRFFGGEMCHVEARGS